MKGSSRRLSGMNHQNLQKYVQNHNYFPPPNKIETSLNETLNVQTLRQYESQSRTLQKQMQKPGITNNEVMNLSKKVKDIQLILGHSQVMRIYALIFIRSRMFNIRLTHKEVMILAEVYDRRGNHSQSLTNKMKHHQLDWLIMEYVVARKRFRRDHGRDRTNTDKILKQFVSGTRINFKRFQNEEYRKLGLKSSKIANNILRKIGDPNQISNSNSSRKNNNSNNNYVLI